MLHTTNPVIKHKAGLLNLAYALSNVSKACKIMGILRDTFYRYRELADEGGMEALIHLRVVLTVQLALLVRSSVARYPISQNSDQITFYILLRFHSIDFKCKISFHHLSFRKAINGYKSKFVNNYTTIRCMT